MKHTEYLRHDFTDAELSEFARDLARSNRTRTSLELKKKAVDSAIKSEIEAENQIIARLSQFIGEGHDWREIDCLVILDTPEPGKKTIRRTDTNADVKVLAMTEADRQMVLDLTAKADAADEAKGPFPMPGAPQAQLPATAETSGFVQKTYPVPVNAPAPAQFEVNVCLVPDSAPLAPAAVMGGTHQRKARAPRDAKREAAADGTETE